MEHDRTRTRDNDLLDSRSHWLGEINRRLTARRDRQSADGKIPASFCEARQHLIPWNGDEHHMDAQILLLIGMLAIDLALEGTEKFV